MNQESVLEEIGLSEGERKVYLALLKLGLSPVNKIKEESQLHRTTIYDFLEKLLNKGLVSYLEKNHVKYFKATHPNKLLELIQEKEENVKEILPDLIKLSSEKKEEITVETFKGIEGFKTITNDILRILKRGEEFIGFGIDESLYKKHFHILMDQYFKKEMAAGIKERMLTSDEAHILYDYPSVSYRTIPKKYFNPNSTIVYKHKVAMIIWDPVTVIIITNPGLADSYRKHFELLWKQAKPIRKKQIKKS